MGCYATRNKLMAMYYTQKPCRNKAWANEKWVADAISVNPLLRASQMFYSETPESFFPYALKKKSNAFSTFLMIVCSEGGSVRTPKRRGR